MTYFYRYEITIYGNYKENVVAESITQAVKEAVRSCSRIEEGSDIRNIERKELIHNVTKSNVH
jgi:hypothetical protein